MILPTLFMAAGLSLCSGQLQADQPHNERPGSKPWTITCPDTMKAADAYLRQRAAWGFAKFFKSSQGLDTVRITLQNCSIDAEGVSEMEALGKFVSQGDERTIIYELANCSLAPQLSFKDLNVEIRASSKPAPRLKEAAKVARIPHKLPNNRF